MSVTSWVIVIIVAVALIVLMVVRLRRAQLTLSTILAEHHQRMDGGQQASREMRVPGRLGKRDRRHRTVSSDSHRPMSA